VIPAASAKMSLRAVGDLAQLFDRFVEVAALGGVPHRGAVKGAVEKLIWRGHASVYRTGVRVGIDPLRRCGCLAFGLTCGLKFCLLILARGFHHVQADRACPKRLIGVASQ
jgi:hypothetical protein